MFFKKQIYILTGPDFGYKTKLFNLQKLKVQNVKKNNYCVQVIIGYGTCACIMHIQ